MDEVVFPSDTQTRMRNILVEDIDTRLKDLTVLVSLQETELALLWVIVIGYGCYLVGKGYHARQGTTRSIVKAECITE